MLPDDSEARRGAILAALERDSKNPAHARKTECRIKAIRIQQQRLDDPADWWKRG